MISEILAVVGWAAAPLVMFAVGGMAIRRQERQRVLPLRVQETRRARPRHSSRTYGRMAEAIRLAEAGREAQPAADRRA